MDYGSKLPISLAYDSKQHRRMAYDSKQRRRMAYDSKLRRSMAYESKQRRILAYDSKQRRRLAYDSKQCRSVDYDSKQRRSMFQSSCLRIKHPRSFLEANTFLTTNTISNSSHRPTSLISYKHLVKQLSNISTGQIKYAYSFLDYLQHLCFAKSFRTCYYVKLICFKIVKVWNYHSRINIITVRR